MLDKTREQLRKFYQTNWESLECKCRIVMADESHADEYECDSDKYGSNDKFTCGRSYEWHTELQYEVDDFIKCNSCKVKGE